MIPSIETIVESVASRTLDQETAVDYLLQHLKIRENRDLRDHFAGQAMQSLVSVKCGAKPKDFARWAYAQADAMIEERNK